MPLSRYFNAPNNGKPGKGAAVMAAMKRRYGDKQGQRVFYATVNKMRSGSPAQQAAQPGPAPGQRPGAALASARRRRRQQLGTPPQATGATINGASTSTSRVGY